MTVTDLTTFWTTKMIVPLQATFQKVIQKVSRFDQFWSRFGPPKLSFRFRQRFKKWSKKSADSINFDHVLDHQNCRSAGSNASKSDPKSQPIWSILTTFWTTKIVVSLQATLQTVIQKVSQKWSKKSADLINFDHVLDHHKCRFAASNASKSDPKSQPIWSISTIFGPPKLPFRFKQSFKKLIQKVIEKVCRCHQRSLRLYAFFFVIHHATSSSPSSAASFFSPTPSFFYNPRLEVEMEGELPPPLPFLLLASFLFNHLNLTPCPSHACDPLPPNSFLSSSQSALYLKWKRFFHELQSTRTLLRTS